MNATARGVRSRPAAGRWLTPEVVSVGSRYAGDLRAVCLGELSCEAFADQWRWIAPEAVERLLALDAAACAEMATAYLAERARATAERRGLVETRTEVDLRTAEECAARWGEIWLPTRLLGLLDAALQSGLTEGAVWAEWEALGVMVYVDGVVQGHCDRTR